jgi:hypothetical protein
VGHCVVDNIQLQLEEWASKRGKCVNYVYKSANNLTELYSAIGAEVPVDSDRSTYRNTELLDALFEANKVIELSQDCKGLYR